MKRRKAHKSSWGTGLGDKSKKFTGQCVSGVPAPAMDVGPHKPIRVDNPPKKGEFKLETR